MWFVGTFFTLFAIWAKKIAEKFFSLTFFCLLCIRKIQKQDTDMEKFSSYIGVLLIVVGAIMLLVSYFEGSLMDTNWYDGLAFVLMVAGAIIHAVKIAKAV